MYSPSGEYVTDFCVVRRDDLYHLFHIRGERWTWPFGYREIDLGHAVSSDLRVWRPLEPVVPAGQEGDWDACGIWAPHIIEVDGVYHMYYTGSDVHNNQAIGLATSEDLSHWVKFPGNPVVEPGPWSDHAVGLNVAGRDAMVFADTHGQRYLMYYTATMADGRACMALAESRDLLRWKDLGPTYVEEDRSYNRLESAYLVAQGGHYYLFYSAKGGPNSKGFSPESFDHFDIVYLVSDDPTGGWSKPANHKMLTDWTCASEHPTFDGTTYMLYIVQEEINGVWGASVLSDPKRLEWQADGTVRILEHTPDNVEFESLFDADDVGFEDWVDHGDGWTRLGDGTLDAAPHDGDAFLMNTLWGEDAAIEADVLVGTNGAASLIVRANPSAVAGYRISLDADRDVIGFYLRIPDQPDRVVQERPVVLVPGTWHKLKVVVQGKFFDIYVDDVLMIVHDERMYEDGCFGLHARGAAQFRHVRAYREVAPRDGTSDWVRHCRPRHLFLDS